MTALPWIVLAALVMAVSAVDHPTHVLSTMRRSLSARFANVAEEYGFFGSVNQRKPHDVARQVRSPLHITPPPAPAPPTPSSGGGNSSRYFYNVLDYGAVADGVTDNTHAFAAALTAGAGSRVFVPAGTYNFLGTLTVPANTALVGVDEYPFRSLGGGSVLTVSYEGGNATGVPFLFLQGPNSGVDGLAVFYTKQNYSSTSPIPYPPCIQGSGDDVSVLNTLLVNPYIAVDFATYPCGRHLIDNLYGQPLSVGVAVDQTYDIGRIRNVHFWTFWTPYPSPIATFIQMNAVAFRFLRTDWEVVEDVFAFGYYRGMIFDQSPSGSCNGQFTNINFDDTGVGLHIRVTQLPGILFSNVNLATDGNQGLGAIAVLVEAPILVSSKTVIRGLSAWGRWQQHVVCNATNGVISVSDSLFMQWNGTNPAVEGIYGRLHLHNSFFSDLIGKGVLIQQSMDRAIVTGNDLVGNSLECEGEMRVCSNNLL